MIISDCSFPSTFGNDAFLNDLLAHSAKGRFALTLVSHLVFDA